MRLCFNGVQTRGELKAVVTKGTSSLSSKMALVLEMPQFETTSRSDMREWVSKSQRLTCEAVYFAKDSSLRIYQHFDLMLFGPESRY